MKTLSSPRPADAVHVALDDVRLANGVRLRYAHRGVEGAPAVLMVHGFLDSWFSFSRVLPLLPERLRLIVPDQRGHGDSDRPAGGYGMDDLARDALALLDALGIEQAAVVGHSMGSFVARAVARRAPARVSRLVLIGTALSPRNDAVQGLVELSTALTDPIDPAIVREFQASTIHRPVPPDFFEGIVEASLKVPARVWRAALAGVFSYEDHCEGIGCPTLVIGGERDAVFTVEEQRAVGSAIPGAVVRVEPGIGHDLHWEDPELFVRLLQGWGREADAPYARKQPERPLDPPEVSR